MDRPATLHTLSAYAFPASYDKNGDGKKIFKSGKEKFLSAQFSREL
jgi:hypothetical protein